MKYLILILALLSSCAAADSPTVPNVFFPWNGYATGSLFVSEAPRRSNHRMPLPNLPLHPKLVWDPIAGAGHYEVQMSRECDISAYPTCAFDASDLEVDVEPSSIAEAPFRPEFALPVNIPRSAADGPGGSRYFWRVRACPGPVDGETETANGCWGWSEVRYLFVGRDDHDTNGDGYADLIVGATGTGTTPEGEQVSGAVFIYFGGDDGIGEMPDLRLSPGNDFESVTYGHSVASGRDLNGDGYADVLVGAPGKTPEDMGVVFVHLGSAAGPSLTPNLVLRPQDGSQYFGWRIKGAGDLNGDGYADLLVSTAGPTTAEVSTGVVHVFYGGESGPALSSDLQIEDPRRDPGASFGFAIDGGGDIDGDGYPDLIVGAPTQSAGADEAAGAAFVFYGTGDGVRLDSGLSIDIPIEGPGGRFGDSVACDGDGNGDGFADVWVGASMLIVQTEQDDPDRGPFYYYRGPSIAGPDGHFYWGSPYGIVEGQGNRGLRYVGDLDGDGYDDVAAQSAQTAGPVDNPFATLIIIGGGPDRLSGSVAPPSRGQVVQFGAASVGLDLNADGYRELIISDTGHTASNGDVEGQICLLKHDEIQCQALANPFPGPLVFGASLN